MKFNIKSRHLVLICIVVMVVIKIVNKPVPDDVILCNVTSSDISETMITYDVSIEGESTHDQNILILWNPIDYYSMSFNVIASDFSIYGDVRYPEHKEGLFSGDLRYAPGVEVLYPKDATSGGIKFTLKSDHDNLISTMVITITDADGQVITQDEVFL